MTFEADLFAVLRLECDDVFPVVAPVTTPRPYVTYQQIGGRAYNYLEASAPDVAHAEVQINVWADTPKAAQALMAALETRLRAASTFQARPLTAPVTDHEPDLTPPAYGCRQDYSIFRAR